MLTKTLKFNDEVIAVLREMEWSEDGKSAKIAAELNRSLYDQVNKALVAMGGKWNRAARAHVFASDPRQQVEGLLSTGAVSVLRDGFFQTPDAVIDRMFSLAAPSGNVLEPSAGLGAIARRVLGYRSVKTLTLIEKDQLRAGTLISALGLNFKNVDVFIDDFLACNLLNLPYPFGFDRVFMNPPFEEGQDVRHVMHAFSLLADGGALVSVMSEGPFFRGDSLSIAFRRWVEMTAAVSEKLPEHAFRASGTDVNTRLLVVRK